MGTADSGQNGDKSQKKKSEIKDLIRCKGKVECLLSTVDAGEGVEWGGRMSNPSKVSHCLTSSMGDWSGH